MSLINEALKRTRDATYQSSARPSDLSGYRYDGARHKMSSNPQAWIVAAALVAVGGLAMGGYFVLNNRQAPVAVVAAVQAVEPAPPVVEEVVVETPEPEPPPLAPVVPAPPPLPEPDPPVLKLQGTTVHAGLKEAMINGQNVRIGDEIEGARVIAIELRRVRLQWRDRELALRMN